MLCHGHCVAARTASSVLSGAKIHPVTSQSSCIATIDHVSPDHNIPVQGRFAWEKSKYVASFALFRSLLLSCSEVFELNTFVKHKNIKEDTFFVFTFL